MDASPRSPQLPEPLPEPFVEVDLDLPGRRDGKVRASFALPEQRRLLVTTDRLSAFDRVIAGVPYKGQVLNELAAWWCRELEATLAAHGAAHHLLDVPDPHAMVVIDAAPLPVEVVVRGCITGVTDTSLWRRYEAGQRVIDGHSFPDGLRKNTALPEPIITPTTKATAGGHDEPLSCADVVERGILPEALWDRVQAVALAVFSRGVEVGAAAGLVLADTKYEFGLGPDGRLLLIDEVHTPDSSRWWIADTYHERVDAGLEPVSLDKEVVRRAFADLGYRGDGPIPELDATVWTDTATRYVDALERITGESATLGTYPVGPRLHDHLDRAGLL